MEQSRTLYARNSITVEAVDETNAVHISMRDECLERMSAISAYCIPNVLECEREGNTIHFLVYDCPEAEHMVDLIVGIVEDYCDAYWICKELAFRPTMVEMCAPPPDKRSEEAHAEPAIEDEAGLA